jgi:hypothetical protein
MPSATDILAGYYLTASRRLKAIVLHPPGGTAGAVEFRRARAAQLSEQVATIVSELRHKASGWVGRAHDLAWREGIKSANDQLRRAGIEARGPSALGQPGREALVGSFALVNRRAVAAFAADTAGRMRANAADTAADLDRAAQSMGRRATSLLRQTGQLGLDEARINQVLAGGVIEGSPRETIRELREQLRAVHGDEVEVPTRSGGTMHFDVDYYARMVAVTKTREAVEIARHGRLAEKGIDLVRIVGRQSNNFCTQFLSQVFSLSGTHPRYPALESLPGGGPPFHPNCSKSTAAYIEELASDAQAEAAQPDPDTRTMIGMTPTQAQRAYKDLQLRPTAERRDRRGEASIGDAALLERARRPRSEPR